MAFADTSRGPIWYEISGSGPRMVLAGGGGFGKENFRPAIPILEQYFTLLIFDQWGYGQSSQQDIETATIEGWADSLAELMDAIGWDKAHLHGTSLGGNVSLATAARHPSKAVTVIANACHAKPDVAHAILFEAMEEHARLRGAITRSTAAFIAQGQMEPDYLDANPQVVDELADMLARNSPFPTWCAALNAMRHADLGYLLPNVKAPTLILAGEHDMDLDLAESGIGLRKMAQLVPGARLEILKGPSHITLFEAPEQHVTAVRRFIEETEHHQNR